MAVVDDEDGDLAKIIKARLEQMAQEHAESQAAKATKPCTCRKCPSCKHAMHIGFIAWLYDHGRIEGDDYPEPLTDEEKARLSRHVLP